jgi:hypothetical protein
VPLARRLPGRLGPPPPYRTLAAAPPTFQRGQPPDLERWRRAASFRVQPEAERLDGDASPLRAGRSRGPGLAIGGQGGEARPGRSIEREPRPASGADDVSPRAAGVESRPPVSGERSRPPLPSDGPHRVDDGVEHGGVMTTLVEVGRRAVLPLAAVAVGGTLYVFRADVMRAFPGTIPIYNALGLARNRMGESP